MTTMFTPTTDTDLERAILAGRRRHLQERRAANVRYDVGKDAVEIELTDGASVRLPRMMIAELADVTPTDLAALQLSPAGYAIKLSTHDIDISVQGLLTALIAPSAMAASLGRLGGSAKSPLKTASAAANGAKGGRPRKVPQAA